MFKEINVERDLLRAQDNLGGEIQRLKFELKPVLVEEREGSSQTSPLKSYGQGEYEIFHGLGRPVSSISIAYNDNLCSLYVVNQATNPSGLDRNNYVRVYIQPLSISGSNIVTTTSTRQLKFWVT